MHIQPILSDHPEKSFKGTQVEGVQSDGTRQLPVVARAYSLIKVLDLQQHATGPCTAGPCMVAWDLPWNLFRRMGGHKPRGACML